MISFKEFMVLLEQRQKKALAGLSDIPRGAMKVSTRVTDLPDNPPYGFWVDRSGNFKVVPLMRHNVVADEIIRRANDYLTKHGAQPIKIFDHANDPYDKLFEDGWLRVVIRDLSKAIYYNGIRGEKPTESQMKFLNFLKDFYDMNSIELKF